MYRLIFCLLLSSCGSSGSQKDYSIKVFAVNIDCQFAEQVVQGVAAKFAEAEIALITDLHCIEWDKSYEMGETEKALAELSARYRKGHFLMPKFGGKYFDGMSNRNGSISVGATDRSLDSVEQAAHEIAHSFGASHDYSSCNIMGYRRCGYPAKFNEKAIEEMR